jgi:hypothetical protein
MDRRIKSGDDGSDGPPITVNNPATRRGVYQFKTTRSIAPIAVRVR